jgi:hypothetical protein
MYGTDLEWEIQDGIHLPLQTSSVVVRVAFATMPVIRTVHIENDFAKQLFLRFKAQGTAGETGCFEVARVVEV